jgi:hypothetical protein
VIFVVRDVDGGATLGCALGPLTDYLVVEGVEADLHRPRARSLVQPVARRRVRQSDEPILRERVASLVAGCDPSGHTSCHVFLTRAERRARRGSMSSSSRASSSSRHSRGFAGASPHRARDRGAASRASSKDVERVRRTLGRPLGACGCHAGAVALLVSLPAVCVYGFMQVTSGGGFSLGDGLVAVTMLVAAVLRARRSASSTRRKRSGECTGERGCGSRGWGVTGTSTGEPRPR